MQNNIYDKKLEIGFAIMFWLTSKFTDIDNLLGMPKICLGNFLGFISLEMAHIRW